MILFDFSPIFIGAVCASSKDLKTPTEGLIRHLVLNTIRSYVHKHKAKYGETVIAIDSGSWRKSVFQYYKAGRNEAREASEIDWGIIFGYMRNIISELEEVYPGRVVQVQGVEADDIIGVLTRQFHTLTPIMILSPDKDMQQLKIYPGVKQFSTLLKKEMNADGRKLLIEKLIKGDKGDGIPNIRSDDNAIVTKKRQPPITAKFLDEAYESDDIVSLIRETFGESAVTNYFRNKKLIDFNEIPDKIKEMILDRYDERAVHSPMRGMKFMNYLVEKEMPLLAQSIGDF